MAWARLALLQAAGDKQALSKLADVFGYDRLPDKEQNDHSSGNESLPGITGIDTEHTVKTPKRPPARFPRVNKIIKRQIEGSPSQQPGYLTEPAMRFQTEDAPAGTYRFAAPKPLLPMARLMPFLFNGLAKTTGGSGLDHRLLMRRIEQGRPLQRLPKRQRLRWPQRLQIIVDTCQRLEPYWADFEGIVQQMQTLLGKEAVQTLRFDENTLGSETCYCLPWPTQDHDQWLVWQTPQPDVAILILSDLGVDDNRAAISWQRQLKCLQYHPSPIVTLSPACRSPDHQRLYHSLSPNPLNDAHHLPRHPVRNGFTIHQPGEQSIADILIWLSPLPLVDTGLLRRLRVELQWGNSALETLIWNHPNVRDIGLGIQVKPTVAKKYQQLFQQRFLDKDNTQRFWDIVQQHHENAFLGLKQLERFKQCEVEETIEPAMRAYFQSLCASTIQSDNDPAQQRALQLQCRTVLASLSGSIWNSNLRDLAYDLYAIAHRDEIRDGQWPEQFDPGFDPERLGWVIDKQVVQDKQQWLIVQIDDQGQALCVPDSGDNAVVTPIAEFEAFQWVPPLLTASQRKQQTTTIPRNGLTLTLPENDTVRVETQALTLELEAIHRPSWASKIWRDADGLRCSIAWLNQELDVFWQVSKNAANGNWRWPPPFGEDAYGLYVDLSVNNVTQRFRWIEPGTFWMGSPEDEPEREWSGNEGWKGSETLHQVTLTQGYWLADSAVTQAFWQAVMGDNPSHFKDNVNNPVEQISWQDAQLFIEKLNSMLPGLSAQLPSEAQWEYTCRAGTSTPFSFGANITPQQVNYDGNFPYADGQKGQDRQQTVPVKSLSANPWGLYEMHGNVWEWCADVWQQQMSSDPVTNPLMTDTGGGASRVVRGGSWNYYGGFVRSAFRHESTPDFRFNDLGLRLALGQAG